MKHEQLPHQEHEDPRSLSQYDDNEETVPVKQYNPQQLKAIAKQGWTCVIGGLLLHMMLGAFSAWGALNQSGIMPFTFAVQYLVRNLLLSFGVKMAQRFGYKTVIFVGGLINVFTSLLASFFSSSVFFVVVFGTLSGIAYGLIYMLPISCGWKYFPFDRRKVSAVIMIGYGVGAFLFSVLATTQGQVQFLRIQSGVFLAVTIVGIFLVRFPKHLNLELQPNYQQKLPNKILEDPICESVGQGVKSRPFTLLLLMMLLSTCGSMWITNLYQLLGSENGVKTHEDKLFLTLIGGGALFTHGITRALWIKLMDKIGFKKLFAITQATNFLVSLSRYFGFSYSLFVFFLINSGGGILACLPYSATKVFGHKVGPAIYGIFSIAIAIIHVPLLGLCLEINNVFGFKGVINLIAFTQILGLGLSFRFRDQYTWSS